MGGEIFASLLLLHALPLPLRQEARQEDSYCGIRGEPRDLWDTAWGFTAMELNLAMTVDFSIDRLALGIGNCIDLQRAFAVSWFPLEDMGTAMVSSGEDCNDPMG